MRYRSEAEYGMCETPRGQAAALGRLVMASWCVTGIALTSVFVVGLVMVVVIAAVGSLGGPPDPRNPSIWQLSRSRG
jgi:hypothetical protein